MLTVIIVFTAIITLLAVPGLNLNHHGGVTKPKGLSPFLLTLERWLSPAAHISLPIPTSRTSSCPHYTPTSHWGLFCLGGETAQTEEGWGPAESHFHPLSFPPPVSRDGSHQQDPWNLLYLSRDLPGDLWNCLFGIALNYPKACDGSIKTVLPYFGKRKAKVMRRE